MKKAFNFYGALVAAVFSLTSIQATAGIVINYDYLSGDKIYVDGERDGESYSDTLQVERTEYNETMRVGDVLAYEQTSFGDDYDAENDVRYVRALTRIYVDEKPELSSPITQHLLSLTPFDDINWTTSYSNIYTNSHYQEKGGDEPEVFSSFWLNTQSAFSGESEKREYDGGYLQDFVYFSRSTDVYLHEYRPLDADMVEHSTEEEILAITKEIGGRHISVSTSYFFGGTWNCSYMTDICSRQDYIELQAGAWGYIGNVEVTADVDAPQTILLSMLGLFGIAAFRRRF